MSRSVMNLLQIRNKRLDIIRQDIDTHLPPPGAAFKQEREGSREGPKQGAFLRQRPEEVLVKAIAAEGERSGENCGEQAALSPSFD